MKRLIYTPLLFAALLTGVTSSAGVPQDDPLNPDSTSRQSALPGRWKVQFSNGVKELCTVTDAMKASVTEPARTALGKVEVRGSSLVIAFDDDRVERWTAIGERFVVEHWVPGSDLHTAPPVLGIADRTPDPNPLLGRWKVQFGNGVKEVCIVTEDMKASVTEPARTAVGKVEVRGPSFAIFYRDDRAERWTPVGEQFIVEHWFPGANFGSATPILGIASSASDKQETDGRRPTNRESE